MKKLLKTVFIIILVILITYLVFNQFDIGEVTPGFSEKDIPIGTYDKNNGYYRLWTLIEPVGTDIESEEVINRVRRLFDPQFDNDKYLNEFDLKTHKKKGLTFNRIFKGAKLRFPTDRFTKDWTQFMLSKRKQIEQLKTDLKDYLDRYQKLIDCNVFEDITLVRFDSPIPNLLVWLKLSKLYIAINILDVMDGNWDQGVSNLLNLLTFTKRAVKGSTVLITDLVGKAINRYTILALASLMNQKECPGSIYQQVLNRTPPLMADEFGSRTSYIGEGLVISSFLDLNFYEDGKKYKKKNLAQRIIDFFLFQKNRVKKVHYDFALKLITYESTPPYQWGKTLDVPSGFTSGLFWWLQNPMGKVFLENMGYPNFILSVAKSYLSKTYYDMLRISAELHLNYSADQPVKEILNGLKTYQTLSDPCTGKPYVWNEQKQILYSLGIDRKDNGGAFNYQKLDNCDYSLPVILYLK